MSNLKFLISLFVLISVSFTAFQPRDVRGEEHDPPLQESEIEDEREVTIDFDNVDIRILVKYISEITGKNFVVDKAVQGNVTILSPSKISIDEAYMVFESVLEVYGYTTVESGAVIKIIPAVDARFQNVQTFSSENTGRPEDRIVTQLVPLTYSSPEEMKNVLTPLMSKSSVVIAHSQSGMLILTDTLSNIQRLMTIIETIDVESDGQEVAVILLKHASSESLAKSIKELYQPVRNSENAGQAEVKVVAIERVNALAILADEAEIERVRRLVTMLDMPAENDLADVQVYYLQHATASELAKVLTEMPTEASTEGEGEKKATVAKDKRITADVETNSLIIYASREEYKVLESVIKKLDIPRQMVYLEALILEVNASKDFDVGVEWSWGSRVSGTDAGAFGVFEGSENIGISDTGLPLGNGLALGVLKQGITIGDVTFPDIKAVLRAYRGDSDINIISTPQILTTDNKKAAISVGENVPYITSQNTTNAEQDYTNYEYRDVATKLTITPHINHSGSMRLEIQTEIVKLKSTSLDLTPTTFQRTAETTVVVNDRETIVLGGIIGEDSSNGVNKVPLLGDIPGLGWLFKTHSTTSDKTNMFIFITPRIMSSSATLEGITLQKQGSIEETMPGAKQMIDPGPDSRTAMALSEKGFNKLVENDLVAARQYLKEALKYDEKNPYALLNTGVVAEREGKVMEAMKCYQQVIDLGGDKVAIEASDPGKKGLPLVQIARQNVEMLEKRVNGVK